MGADCSCCVPLWMIRCEVDSVYYYAVFSHPAGMVLSGRFIGFVIRNILFLHVLLSVFIGFLMPLCVLQLFGFVLFL